MGLSAPVALTHNEKLATWFRAQRWAIGFNSLCSVAHEPTETDAGKDQGRAARDAAEVVRNTQPQPERSPKAKKGRGPVERSHAKAAKVFLDRSCAVALGLHGGVLHRTPMPWVPPL